MEQDNNEPSAAASSETLPKRESDNASQVGGSQASGAAPDLPGGHSGGAPREVSAATIGRMMGLATQTEFKLLEGKVDLLSTRLGTVATKLEKLSQLISAMPSGSDLERIDVQIGALRTLLKESLGAGLIGGSSAATEARTEPPTSRASGRIQSNTSNDA